MSSSIIESAVPLLNYVGAVDVGASEHGHMSYDFFFDGDISGLGKVLMFEWKISDPTIINPTPENVTLGFVNTEHFIMQSGIQNQYILSVPSLSNDYNSDTPVAISFRMYVGLNGSSDIAVTKWSNYLTVHSAPVQPEIFSTFFDAPSLDKDELYVFLDVEPLYGDDIKFMVAYYYKNSDGQTVWTVSDPLPASLQTIGSDQKLMVHVENFNVVSPSDLRVFVAVYATYNYQGPDLKNYYSVSRISSTEIAEPAENYASPTFTSVVYDNSASHLVNLTWVAPLNSGIPTFQVQKYQLERSDNGINGWVLISDANVLTYQDTISSNVSKYYRVRAISSSNTPSPYSDITANFVLNAIDYKVYSDKSQNMDLSWNNPLSSINSWQVTSYAVSKKVGSGSYSEVINSLSALSYRYDSLVDAENAALTFKVVATLTHSTTLNTYNIVLNTKSINKFLFASPVRNVEIDQTGINSSNQVSMRVGFKRPDNMGPGTPQRYEILIMNADTVKATIPVTYLNQDDMVHPIENNGDILYQGDVRVRLVTQDTNDPLVEQLGDLSDSKPYVAANVVLEDVVYQVYSNKSQNMVLTWSNALPNTNLWQVYSYAVLKKVGSSGSYSEVTTLTGDNLSHSYIYDSSDAENAALTFKVIATLKHSTTFDTYAIESNEKSINKFVHSTPVRNVVIDQTGINNSNEVSMRVRFKRPDNMGPGAPLRYEILIMNADTVKATIPVTYLAQEDMVHTITDNDDILYQGDVRVRLVTQDTNSPFDDLDGELSDREPYVAANVVLDNVVYQVYSNKTQNMVLTWSNALPNTNPWHVTSYAVLKKVDSGSYSEVPGSSTTALSYTYVSADSQDATLTFKVVATLQHSTTFDTYVIESNEESVNKFVHSTQVRNVVIDQTGINSTRGQDRGRPNQQVSMRVGFKRPDNMGPGTPLHYKIIIKSNGVLKDTIEVPYLNQEDMVHPIGNNGNILYQGDVTVHLVTQDTNSPFDNLDGELSDSKPYVAANVVLEDVVYQVYSNKSQNMVLTWSNALPNTNPWQVTSYAVLKKVDSGSYSEVPGSSTTALSYIYDSSVDADNAALTFKVVATLTHSSSSTSYVIESNEESINKFVHSTQVRNVVIYETGINSSNQVSMRVRFERPANMGPGTPLHYKIIIKSNGVLKDTIEVPYLNQNDMVHTITDNGAILYQGDVTVHLVTRNTNSPFDNLDGELSDSKPYVAANVVLDDVVYQVYSNKSQNMVLTWSNALPNPNPWQVTSYAVSKKVGSSGSYSEVTGSSTTAHSYTYVSADSQDATLTFKVVATLTHSSSSTSYVIESNEESINKFVHSTQVRNVVIDQTGINSSNQVSMRVRFERPDNMGPGTPQHYKIIIKSNGVLKDTIQVPYLNQNDMVHPIENNGNILYQGDVTVHLVTRNTNSPFDNLDGELSDSKPYVAANVVLEDVDYRVYEDNNQYMDLVWNNCLSIPNPWQVTRYSVLMKVDSGSYSEVTDPLTALIANFFTYNSENITNCGTLLTFKVEATLTHTSSYTSYQIVSNEKSRKKFYKSDAPQNLKVVSAVTNINTQEIDLRATFSNPLSVGCGAVQNYFVTVFNSVGGYVESKTVTYSSSAGEYEVNFNNISHLDIGRVAVHLITEDNNGNGNIEGLSSRTNFQSSSEPQFTFNELSSDKKTLTLQIVSSSLLDRIAAYVFKDADAKSTFLKWSTLSVNSTNLIVVRTRLLNDEYKYSITLKSAYFSLNEFHSEFGLIVSNFYGVEGVAIGEISSVNIPP